MSDSIDFSQWIPIFPLPNAVLMPRAVLPLHVFEHRYREMTWDALCGSKLIAMALLKPGHEERYHTLHAEIHPVVCVGRILREEELTDGRYNFLLRGLLRAKVMRESTDLSYRRARLRPVYPVPAQPEVECACRQEIRRLLRSPPLLQVAESANWLQVLRCPEFTLSDMVDVLAGAVLPDVRDRQRLLSEACVATRAACICNVLRAISVELDRRPACADRSKHWPPSVSEN